MAMMAMMARRETHARKNAKAEIDSVSIARTQSVYKIRIHLKNLCAFQIVSVLFLVDGVESRKAVKL